MTDPERIGSLAAPVLEILERRCKAAVGAKPRAYSCAICEDEGLVWVRRRHGKDAGYTYFDTIRCHSDKVTMGYLVLPEDVSKDSKRRSWGPRRWDRQIRTYMDAGIPAEQVYSMSARAAYEEQEHQQRKAADDPAARAEREAMREEGGEPARKT